MKYAIKYLQYVTDTYMKLTITTALLHPCTGLGVGRRIILNWNVNTWGCGCENEKVR